MPFVTFKDAVDHAVDYLGGNVSDVALRDSKRAVVQAYRDVANAHRWSYYMRHGRIQTNAPYDGTDPAGVNPRATIAYDASTGQMTLSGATWPSWTAGGYLRSSSAATPDDAGLVAFRVEAVVSPTVIRFDPEVRPAGNITAGSYFKLYQDTYLLPEDFISQDQAYYERNFGGMDFVSPNVWLYENRYVFAEGTPQFFTITGDVQYPGRLVMRVMPYPSDNKSIDFVYQRKPRPLLVYEATAGRVATTSGSATVTGSGTTFAPAMVGSIFRLSGTTQSPVSSFVGNNPAVMEATVLAVASPTSLTLDAVATGTVANLTYSISDPIDVEDNAMLRAFFRSVEHNVAIGRTLKDKPATLPAYQMALAEARSADSRSFQGRRCGMPQQFRRRLRDYPYTFAIE